MLSAKEVVEFVLLDLWFFVRCSVDRCLSFCPFSSDCPSDLVSSTFLMTVPLGKAIHIIQHICKLNISLTVL